MHSTDDPRLTPAEAGRLFDPPISAAGVRRYDPILQPERTPTGRRLYLAGRVAAFVAERQRRRATAAATPATDLQAATAP